jgi:hypothetical protein
MAGPASLALLKPKSKTDTTPTQEAPKKVDLQVESKTETTTVPEIQTSLAPSAPAEETFDFDVDKATGAQIDALIKEQEIKVPDGWSKMKLADKRAWLKTTFSDDGGTAQTSDVQAAPPAAPVAEAPQIEPVKKPSKTAAALDAGKAKAPVKSVTGEVMTGKDVLHDMVHDIENLKEKEARALIGQLLDQGGQSDFKLGGILSLVQQNGWYTPYASFREFIEAEYGIHYRKAMNLIEIYNALIEAKVPWDKVKHLGWTKLSKLAKVLSEENSEDWIKVAAGQTVLQLEATIDTAKKADTPLSEVEGEAVTKTVTTKTFKVHSDQLQTINAALDKAKEMAGTSVDTVALDFICIDFLGGSKALPLKDQMVKVGIEQTLEQLQAAFPTHNFQVEAPE